MGLFKDTLKFPFHPFKRMWWFWIAVIPVAGWIMLAGYLVDINRSIIHKKQGLPPFGEFWHTAKMGLYYAIISVIYYFVSYYAPSLPYYFGWVIWLYLSLVVPVLLVHFSAKRHFKEGFNLPLATKLVFGNFGKYIKYMVYLIGVLLIWTMASIPIITLLLTLPAMYYGTIYLFAQFYSEVTE